MAAIYKICPQSLWNEAQRVGAFKGSPADLHDGFIHFSTAAQVMETAIKHFAGQHDLVLLAVDPEKLGPSLKWEVSRGGALFPHLYGDIDVQSVLSVVPLPLGRNGRHCFPLLFD
jgi:uncharacterized protein (DUF952 family)